MRRLTIKQRRACPAARLLALELEIARAADWYARTRPHRALAAVRRLQTQALRGGR